MRKIKDVYIEKLLFLGLQWSKRAENGVKMIAEIIVFCYEIELINHMI